MREQHHDVARCYLRVRARPPRTRRLGFCASSHAAALSRQPRRHGVGRRNLQAAAGVQRGLPQQGAQGQVSVQDVPPQWYVLQATTRALSLSFVLACTRAAAHLRLSLCRSLRRRKHLSRYPPEPVEPYLRYCRRLDIHPGALRARSLLLPPLPSERARSL